MSTRRKWKRGSGLSMQMFIQYAEEDRMFMWNDRAVTYGFLSGMPLRTIRKALSDFTIVLAEHA